MKNELILFRTLTSRRQTLSTAESCTGGLIAKKLTDLPGSSAFFLAGFIAYSNAAKTRFLRVPSALIKKHGAVSAEVAQAMAKGARKVTGSDFAIAATGIAGPSGGTPSKPVGLVFVATASATGAISQQLKLKGSRCQIRQQACSRALQLLVTQL